MPIQDWLSAIKEYGPWVVLSVFLIYCLVKLGWEVFKMMREDLSRKLDSIMDTQQDITKILEKQALIISERLPRQGGNQ